MYVLPDVSCRVQWIKWFAHKVLLHHASIVQWLPMKLDGVISLEHKEGSTVLANTPNNPQPVDGGSHLGRVHGRLTLVEKIRNGSKIVEHRHADESWHIPQAGSRVFMLPTRTQRRRKVVATANEARASWIDGHRRVFVLLVLLDDGKWKYVLVLASILRWTLNRDKTTLSDSGWKVVRLQRATTMAFTMKQLEISKNHECPYTIFCSVLS